MEKVSDFFEVTFYGQAPPAMLNYKHLHYFWVVAKEGSITRAAERLGVAVQTISGQLSLLERQFGKALFVTQGRRLALSETGRIALRFADQIFQLGEQLEEAIAQDDNGQILRLRVGISDSIPKLLAYRLLTQVTALPGELRLICLEGSFDNLLADLALHRLDLVLTDRAAPATGNLKVFSTHLGEFSTGLFASPKLTDRQTGFPASLNGAPLLLPTRHNALRVRIDRWFDEHGLLPRIVGEFQDSALLTTFGRGGLGIFPAPLVLSEQLASEYDAQLLGDMAGVAEQIHAISTERKIRHPAIEALCRTVSQSVTQPPP